jgi:hypothetical protein
MQWRCFGDFVLMKKQAGGVVEDVGIVFEIKSTRFLNKAFVIDSHGLALVDNQYDVRRAFSFYHTSQRGLCPARIK